MPASFSDAKKSTITKPAVLVKSVRKEEEVGSDSDSRRARGSCLVACGFCFCVVFVGGSSCLGKFFVFCVVLCREGLF